MEIVSVAQFNRIINTLFSEIGEFAVTGEVTDINFSRNGAVFMDLHDKSENAILKISQYAPRLSGVKSISIGMEVVVRGAPEIYSPYGSFSFKPYKIEPVGEGALKQAFENLKLALEQQGYFALTRKRPLPGLITKIALITGKDSAAYADFCKILRENKSAIEIDFYPVLVQGEKSPEEIVAAIELACTSEVDVIALIRGGGSLEDLQAFNSEPVAKAIFTSRVPVLVGVGHEIDTTIADLVADVRAATPSQGAYYLLKQNLNLLEQLSVQLESIEQELISQLPSESEIVHYCELIEFKLKNQLPSTMEIINKQRVIQMFLQQYEYNIQSLISRVKLAEQYGIDYLNHVITRAQQDFARLESLLTAYSPKGVLKRGYALLQNGDTYLSSINQINPQDILTITIKDGRVVTRVTDISDEKINF